MTDPLGDARARIQGLSAERDQVLGDISSVAAQVHRRRRRGESGSGGR